MMPNDCRGDRYSEKLLNRAGVYGFFRRTVWVTILRCMRDETRTHVLTTFHTLRQQTEKPEGQTIWRWRITSRRNRPAPGSSGRVCRDGRDRGRCAVRAI